MNRAQSPRQIRSHFGPPHHPFHPQGQQGKRGRLIEVVADHQYSRMRLARQNSDHELLSSLCRGTHLNYIDIGDGNIRSGSVALHPGHAQAVIGQVKQSLALGNDQRIG